MTGLVRELPMHIVYNTHGFYGCSLHLILGQGLGAEILCQIPDVVTHDIEKTKCCAGGGEETNTAYRANTEKYIYSTVPCRASDIGTAVYRHDTEENVLPYRLFVFEIRLLSRTLLHEIFSTKCISVL